MRTLLVVLSLAAMVPGCKRVQHRSPEALREAYVDALPSDDPKIAYAMLTPEVQASVPYEAFAARWTKEQAERGTRAKTAAAMSPANTSETSSRLLACILTRRPIRSRRFFVLLSTYEPDSNLPE